MKPQPQQTSESRAALTLGAVLLAALSLVACETPSGSKPAASAVKPVAVAASAAEPAPAPVVVEALATVTPPLMSAQKLVTGAIELLEAGNEEQASADLQRALQVEPGHKLALQLLKQITADPLATLGRESFIYRVQAGETLSRIAQRFLGDVHQFYILARYNDIKVPRQLAGGQMIRVPGKAPAAGTLSGAAPVAPIAAGTSGAAKPGAAASAATTAPNEAGKAERERTQNIARLTRAARAAFAKQDLDNAIKAWDQVLELDSNNNTAKLERQRAVDLKERLGKVK